MRARYCFLITTMALALIGSTAATLASAEKPGGPILVVTASYPGANAQSVADTVAVPIEQQINGVEGMVRIESTSGSDGKYIAHLYFERKTDPQTVLQLVQNRVALATMRLLPDVVRGNTVAVKLGKTEADPKEVAVAVIDRHQRGWEALQKVASAAAKRLAAEGALTNPQVFPQSEKQVSINLDSAKCADLRVSLFEVDEAIVAAGSKAKIDDLKKLVVRDKVLLSEVATFKEATGPNAVYRIDLYPAIRITGAPPAETTLAAAAAKCVKVVKVEMTRPDAEDFAVENVSAK